MRNHRNHRNRRNKFRSRSNDRIFRRKPEGLSSNNINYISNGIQRQSFGNNNHNAPKLLEKYNNLAREALSNGDKILSENYYQHADHFLRIMSNENVGLNNSLDKGVKESQSQTDNKEPQSQTDNNDENKSVVEISKQNKEI